MYSQDLRGGFSQSIWNLQAFALWLRTSNATLLRGVLILKLFLAADLRILLVGSAFRTGEDGL